MSSVLAAPPGTQVQSRRARGGLLQGFGQRHVAVVIGFAVLTPLVQLLFTAAMGETVHYRFLPYEFAVGLAIGSAAQLSALVTGNLMRSIAGTVWRLSIAIAVAAVGATALIQLIDFAVAGPLGLEQLMAAEGKAFASAAHRIAFEFAGATRWSLVLVVFCELLEANHRAQHELHAVRMTALAAERDLVEGGLRAMQARVDPDLLFDSLLDIDRSYARDIAAGQDQLDALIRFLRAALPGGGNGGSTVTREQALVQAYVALVRLRSERDLELELAVEPAARDEPMPAMLLLPLARWALAGRTSRRLHIGIRRHAADLTIEVESDAGSDDALPEGEIASVRARLAQLYAQGARLSVESAPGARRAALAIPLPRSAAAALACAA